MDPINYSGAFADQSPLQAFTDSLKTGAEIQNLGLTQQLNQYKVQQQVALQKDLSALGTNPDPHAIAALSVKYPALSEQFKRSYDMLNQDQQQNKLNVTIPVYAAIQNGRPDLAANQLLDHATALDNSGQAEEAQRTRTMAQFIKDHPEQAKVTTGLLLSSAMGADKFASTFGAIGQEGRAQDQAPGALAKVNADASTAQSEAVIKKSQADAAPTTVKLGNAKTAQEIAKMDSDAKVAQFNAEIAAADSETKRGQLTLERDKYIQEQAKLNQAQGNAAQDGMDALTQGLQTVKSIKDHPGLTSAWGLGGVGSTTGKISGFIPGTDRKDLEGLVDTLKSQQFLAGVKQLTGMGSLSNAEGEKIGAAVASLNLDQSPQAFKNALGVIEKYMTQAQAKTVARGQLPTSGGAYVTTVPGIGVVDEGHINAILKATPGATREQVIKFLQQSGGK